MSEAREERLESESEQHDIRFEVQGLITLLAQHLYADPDVFLREMIQNAHDSIIKRRAVAAERGERANELPPGLIRIVPDRDARTLVIEDNGSGLTREEIHSYLSTIGRSGTRELKERLRDRDRGATIELIGQFGIGLLSAFIVASRVEIVTRSPVEPALRWISDGGQRYQVEPAERAELGSAVTLHLRADHRRYLDPEHLRRIIRTYADYIGVPIHLGVEAEPSNAVEAPWHRRYSTDAERRQAHHLAWERRFVDERSLDVLALDEPVSVPDPARPGAELETRIRGVLGITDRHVPDVNTRGTVDVYIARMFIASGSREILPPWARFIQGVIECDALAPNAARDDVVRNEALTRVRDLLGRVIVDWLGRLSTEDPRRFHEIMRWHAYHVLAMSVQEEHEAFFRAVADLVPLESDKGPLTVRGYLETAAELPGGERVVHYLTERGSALQYYVLCGARGIHVFNASEPFAERFLDRYARTFPGRIRLSRLDVSGSEVIFTPVPESDPDHDRFRALEAAYARVFPDLRCIAQVSRFQPADLPAVLTESSDQRARREMQQVADNVVLPGVIRDLVKGFLKERREPLSLHLNADNPTIQRLARRGKLRDEVVTNALVSLYNNAFMLLSRSITPADVQVMFRQYNHVIDAMLALADDREKLQGEKEGLLAKLRSPEGGGGAPSGPRLTRYVTCFAAMPFDKRGDGFFEALRRVLEDAPFLWRVTRADAVTHRASVWENVRAHMQQAHCFAADVTGSNPNVMIEVGRMEALGRPILLLKEEGSQDLPADLRGHTYVSYGGEGEALERRLREEIRKVPAFARQVGDRYLSETVIVKSGVDRSVAQALRLKFETCEELLAADPEETARLLRLQVSLVRVVQEGLKELLETMA